jgi:uncharacterized membrane protein
LLGIGSVAVGVVVGVIVGVIVGVFVGVVVGVGIRVGVNALSFSYSEPWFLVISYSVICQVDNFGHPLSLQWGG